MGNSNVIFTLDGRDIAIQCSNGDKMRDICQKFAAKAETNINSLIFLYGGNQVNMNLSLEAQASSLDKKNNEMKILVYRKENEDELTCPKCGEKISLNPEKINDLISSYDNLRDSISGIQDQLDNVIKNSTVNKINNQLKNIKTIINTINEDIKKNNEKFQNLLHDIIASTNLGSSRNTGRSEQINRKEIDKLEKEKINLKKELEILKEKLEDVSKEKNIFKKKYEQLIKEKDEKISILEENNKTLYNGMKNALKSSLPFDIEEGEKLMCLIFVGYDDQRVHFPIICKNTHRFNELENLIYEKWPEYKETNNFFICNGHLINRSKTLTENGIKDRDIILMTIDY